MNRKKILKLIASLAMLMAGIFNLVFQFCGNKIFIYSSSICFLLFGILIVVCSILNNSDDGKVHNNKE